MTSTDGPTSTKGTRPECAYIGGHADGYDPDCAWCHGHEPERSKITHKCELVEKHRLTTGLHADDAETVLELLKQHARGYADAHGFELTGTTAIWLTPGPKHDQHKVALEFTVHVGHGDISTDQRVLGALDTWTWSARVQWWAKLLRRIGRPVTLATEAGRIVPGPWSDPTHDIGVDLRRARTQAEASYRALITRQDHEIGSSLDAADQRPPWLHRADGWDEDGR